jgi:2'-5' RNA ligase
METIRSFIAIELPGELVSRFAEVLREFRRTEADVKWIRPEAIHLTLKFLGSIRPEAVEKISRALAPVVASREPFEVGVQGVGCFPSLRNPRVVWVGVDRGKDCLVSLQQEVEEKMAGLSFPAEDRPFTPHLTLGRVRSSRGKADLSRAVESRKGLEWGKFQAREVILFRSELKPSGAVYSKLKEFPLGKQEGINP